MLVSSRVCVCVRADPCVFVMCVMGICFIAAAAVAGYTNMLDVWCDAEEMTRAYAPNGINKDARQAQSSAACARVCEYMVCARTHALSHTFAHTHSRWNAHVQYETLLYLWNCANVYFPSATRSAECMLCLCTMSARGLSQHQLGLIRKLRLCYTAPQRWFECCVFFFSTSPNTQSIL